MGSLLSKIKIPYNLQELSRRRSVHRELNSTLFQKVVLAACIYNFPKMQDGGSNL